MAKTLLSSGQRIPLLVSLLLIALANAQCIPAGKGGATSNGGAGNLSGSPPLSGGAVTADQVLDRYVQAMGGAQAISSVSSIAAKGEFEIPEIGTTGTVLYYFKSPDRFATTVRTSDGQYSVFKVCDGAKCLQRAVNSSLGTSNTRELLGDEMEQAKIGSDFYAVLKLKELYPKRVLSGKQKLEENEVYTVEVHTASGQRAVLYFDVANGLLLRRDFTEISTQGRRRAQVYFDDYREIAGASGVKVAYTASTFYPDNDEGNGIVHFTEVRANVPTDDSLFMLPRR